MKKFTIYYLLFIISTSLMSAMRVLKKTLWRALNSLSNNQSSIIHNQYSRGFSLIELIVYMGLFSVILAVTTELFASSISNRLESESTAGVESDGMYIFLHLQRALENSTTISTPSSYGSPGSSLTVSDGTNTYSYSLSGGNLVRTYNAQTEQLNGYNTQVTNLSFVRMRNGASHDSVKISYTLQSTVRSNIGYETKTYQTTLGTR